MARAAQKPLQRKLVLENLALELFPVTYHRSSPRRASCERSVIDGSHVRRLRPVITCSGFCSQAAAKRSRENRLHQVQGLDQFCKKSQQQHKGRRYLVKGQKGGS